MADPEANAEDTFEFSNPAHTGEAGAEAASPFTADSAAHDTNHATAAEIKKKQAEFQKVLSAVKRMQDAQRELMDSTVGFAAALESWSAGDENPWLATLCKNGVSPTIKEFVKSQAEVTIQIGSVTQYEGSSLIKTSDEYAKAIQELTKAQKNRKAKGDALAKAKDTMRVKAEAADMTAKDDLATASKVAAAKKRDFQNIKHTALKSGVMQFARSFQRFGKRNDTAFTTLFDVAETMPDALIKTGAEEMESALSQCAKDMQAKIKSDGAAIAELRRSADYLTKKPEKMGSAQTRFFQIELVNDEGTESLALVYYKEVPTYLTDGEKKGVIPIGMGTTVESKQKNILITGPNRKWTLIASSSAEASWWREYLQKAAQDPASISPAHTMISPDHADVHGGETYQPPQAKSEEPAKAAPTAKAAVAAMSNMAASVASPFAGMAGKVASPFADKAPEVAADSAPEAAAKTAPEKPASPFADAAPEKPASPFDAPPAEKPASPFDAPPAEKPASPFDAPPAESTEAAADIPADPFGLAGGDAENKVPPPRPGAAPPRPTAPTADGAGEEKEEVPAWAQG